MPEINSFASGAASFAEYAFAAASWIEGKYFPTAIPIKNVVSWLKKQVTITSSQAFLSLKS